MLLIDKQIGRYKIRRKIGAGGMGEVYLAHDAQLDRTVALKILSGEFAADDVSRHRFKQEARAVSALNHPNILTIHEIGETEEGYFIATEYVEGETLRGYLRDSPLRVVEAVRIAEQIAQALVAAHNAGIVHRDIKPENVMMRRDGYVKVLDFGLAKSNRIGQNGDYENTAQIVNTVPGMVMGSVRYMSPEQARGLAVDERTDLWSLGAVLYEMLAGCAPFQEATITDTLAALIHLEPAPLVNLAPNAPTELNRIVFKALRKDPEERYQNAKDLALDLKNLLYDIEHEISLENKVRQTVPTGDINENPTLMHDSASISSPPSAPAVSTSISSAEYLVNQVKTYKPQIFLIGLALTALIAALGFGAYYWAGDKSKTSSLFEKTQVSKLSSDGKVQLPAISPDGKYVAYASGEVGGFSVVVRQLATDSMVTLVPSSPLVIKSVNFSPDGDYVFYTQLTADYTFGTLYRVPTLGGAPKKIAEDVDSDVSFSPDGKQFAFMRHNSGEDTDEIHVSDARGANVRRLASTSQTELSSFTAPTWSPDGTKILVGTTKRQTGTGAKMTLAEISAADGNIKTFGTKEWSLISNPIWLKDNSGFLMIAKESDDAPRQIWRIAYPGGESYPVTNDTNSYSGFGISSDNRTLSAVIYNELSSVHSYAPETKELIQLTAESPNLEGSAGVAQIKDGTIIFNRREGKDMNLWAMSADGKNEKRLIDDAGINNNPVASPDGNYIVFNSNRSKTSSLWRIDAADGAHPVQLSAPVSDESDMNPQITPDGKTVIFLRRSGGGKRSKLFKTSIDGGQAAPLAGVGQTIEIWQPNLSPDGKRLVYMSFNQANNEKKLQIVRFDGENLGVIENTFEYKLIDRFKWSPDGKSITYLSSEGIPNLWKLPLDGSPPQPITNFKSGRIFNFSWSADGKNLFITRGIVSNNLVLIKDATLTNDQTKIK
ncbi:MAG: protein kinase [Acidobacteriota bacterium]|nr:protein kinase [Acidobacteriota bacterium]